tara:strand:+ start:6844 stop:7698 length:855 start_codon:yes stop_codon:yes gene_type:complete
MAINRVHSSEAQLFVGDQRIPAVSSLDISSSKEIEYIPRLGAGHSVEGVLMPNQNSTLSYGITLTTGATGIDPFYSYQQMQSGFLSTGSFEFKVKDLAGVETISGASLTSYSLNGSVGSVVAGNSTYVGDGAIFTPNGALERKDQSKDLFDGFFSPKKIEVTTTTNGEEGISSSTLHIQDFTINVGIDKVPITRLGTRVPITRFPTLPSQGSLSFNVIKNQVTGLDLSSLICESGVIKIDLKDINNNSVLDFVTSGCCLETVDESTSLDDNTTLSFNYYFPIIQ